ncbi:shikimate kinase [Pseudarcicella hirudinis]|uniref:Shikimate kinase n=1 Tax=Pseudarcicella hirudinis TaxID=1079859 RepID=A0A1I5YF73_9BACT|nr:shikimate kinase [Pseudarcicella hirudinis]SFQ42750.1 shikimate kinase [Pseudarcicella hirudinis]
MKNIFLIGMPSSGKSTLGKQLAKALNYQFVDMDELIERAENKTIPEIFNLNGEEYFRKAESEILRQFHPDQGLVIATGGGVPCFFDNMTFIKSTGVSVFLNVEPVDLIKRLRKSDANNRPLINKNLKEDELFEELQNRYNHRLPYYAQADIKIDGNIEVEQLMWLLDEL